MMDGSENQHNETRQSSPGGLIIRQKQPVNLEMPFDQLDSHLTPTELFYIRSHFPTPSIDRQLSAKDRWRFGTRWR
jgi:hypothetical protein